MTAVNTARYESDIPKRVQWTLGLSLGIGLSYLFRLVLPALIPGENFTQSEQLTWYLTRSSGVVGYLLLTLSTIWGLLLSTRLIKSVVPPALSLTLHSLLAWTAIGLSVFHAGLLLFDKYYTYTIADLLIPFTGPYKPGWVGAGVIGFYFMALTSASFTFRRYIGQKSWRRLHYLTFPAYILITIHGITAGTDAGKLAMVYAGSGLTAFFLTVYRILSARAKR